MIDISAEPALRQYLVDNKHVSSAGDCTITYCGGGVSGTVAFVTADGRDMIVKQALAKLKVKEEWLCDPNRMHIEMKSNEIYHRLAPEYTPAVYFYDHENFIFGREAAPTQCVMWKQNLMDGLLNFVVSEKVIRAMLIVHNECARDKQVAKVFADKGIFYELRISPYIEFTVSKYPHLAEFAKPIIKELMESAITLVHGDYSPKNIMVDGQKIYVMDFEVAHYGHPSFDLAFLSNHLVLKSVHNRPFGTAYLAMLRSMLNIYFGEMDYMDKDKLETSFIELLALLMHARIDGKSPVEYLVGIEDKKELVRQMAFAIIDRGITTYDAMLKIVRKYVEEV